jgi:CBS domain-containing protein
MPKARDLMQTHVVTVGPDTPLLDVYRLFAEEQIGAAPVVDEAEQVIGVVSTADLVRTLDEERDTAWVQTNYLRDVVPFSSPDWDNVPEDLQNRWEQLRVSDAMTDGIVTMPPDASASEIARTLRKHRLHHVFVVEDGVLCGVISTYDLLQLVEKIKDE